MRSQSPLRLPNVSGSLLGALIGLAVLAVIIFGALAALSDRFFYFLVQVETQEVGVQFRDGKIYQIVGPGLYSDIGLSVKLEKVSSQAIPFSVRDEEIITSDKQRIGLVVSADVFQPNLGRQDVLQNLWPSYQNLYIDDEAAKVRVQDLARQGMKVCVGERTFDNAIIGTARDDLRACIDQELSKLAENIGLQIENVVVPEVVLSPEVQAALDAIVQSRLQTEKAAQDKLRVEAEAQAEQAKQEGEVRVAQSRIQEETKQQTLLAKLNQEKIAAQRAVIEAEKANELAQVEAQKKIIEAQKANDLLAAQQDLEINKAQALAAAEQAKADIAPQVALAELYARNPGYLQLQVVQANASALTKSDKIIFTPVGTTPTIVVPGPGITPTTNVTPQ